MTSDQAQIVAVAALCAVAVGAVGLLVAWLVRHRSVRWQLGLVVVVSTASVVLGVLAVSRLMFLSTHDWGVVSLVTVVAGAVSLVVALVLGVAISRWSEAIRESARTLDSHGSYVADPRGPSELQALCAELGLDDPARSDDELLDAMRAHPVLINRPIVATPLGVRLCRPPERVLEILPDRQGA